ncbi:acetyltransferase [Vibrio coralliirubri]|uniref:acetyltransferase n=1 Tax=Vibrio coralliirubri TaxID=1516159 RepID=UPI0006315AB8|nr:acetyltransferase [Vibrio coralliirubri]CDU11022.1 Sialic acid biosynthesis protein NeuD [Vibrio coralliirubri]
MNKKQPVIVIGGGGHASVLVDILNEQKRTILAIVSPDSIETRQVFSGYKRLKTDSDVRHYSSSEILLVNGIGPQPRSKLKQKINDYFIEKGYRFETIVANSAFVSPYSKLGDGVQILNHAIIQTGTVVGAHSIINTGAVIEHDCSLGTYNHIAPNATLCGQVVTERNVYIGAGSTVINNIAIGHDAIVGAGSVLTHSLGAEKTCYPFRTIIK